jgi:peptidoglycan/xylan/chitin deacetylase (PgdA/CDA1 family)
MAKYALFTNDIETTSIWFNSLRDETGYKVLKEGMPILLDIYDKYNVKSTFFFTGYITKLYPEIVKITAARGHEIGNHSWSHDKKDGHDVTDLKTQIQFVSDTKKLLEDLSGQEVISFRSPALRVNNYTPQALIETGHKIDSSVPSQRFDFFLSFGSRKKLKWLNAPRKPYYTKRNDLSKKGKSPIIEIPLSAGFFSYIGTTMRIFPGLTNLQKQFHHWESSINKKPVVFDIHPNEFIDESNEPRAIERRSSNFLSYYLQDVIRSRLKAKNLGPNAIPLYESQLSFFKEHGYKFTTVRKYCEEKGMLGKI